MKSGNLWHQHLQSCDGAPVPDQDLNFVGYMSGSCVKACNLCYPTLPAAELRRRQGTEESDSVEGRAIERQDPDAPHVEDVSPPLGTLSIVDGVWLGACSAC